MTHRIQDGYNNSLQFVMNRGGVIEFFPGMDDNIVDIRNGMMCAPQFRQYKVRTCANEPRRHALFSSTPPGEGGYQYGRVTMENHPLQTLTIISEVAKTLASQFHLEKFRVEHQVSTCSVS
jgi:hypothetical protein